MRERYHQTSIPQLESYVAQVTKEYVFQCYATIRKQYWQGMGFSNVYVYADEFSLQYVLWTRMVPLFKQRQYSLWEKDYLKQPTTIHW